MRNNSIFQSSPNSPASWPPDAFGVWPSIAAAIGGVIFYYAGIIVLVRVLGVSAQSIRSVQLTPPIVEAQLLGYVPILAYMAVVLPALARRPFSEIVGPFTHGTIPLGLIGALCMWLAVTIVGAIEAAFFGHQPTQTAIRLFENAKPGLWLDVMALVAVTLAPLVEELIFRGFIFNALWKRMPFGASAVGSGILFGLAHGQAAGVAPLAAGGVVLAAVYARTGSLWTSMIAHGTFNGITLALLLFGGGIHK